MQGAVPLAPTADDSGNVKVSDEDCFLSRNVTMKANNKIVKELSEFGSVEKQQSQQQAKRKRKRENSDLGPTMSFARLYFSLCIKTLEKPKLHLDFYVTLELPVCVVSKSFVEVVKVAQRLESTMQPVSCRQVARPSCGCSTRLKLLRVDWRIHLSSLSTFQRIASFFLLRRRISFVSPVRLCSTLCILTLSSSARLHDHLNTCATQKTLLETCNLTWWRDNKRRWMGQLGTQIRRLLDQKWP